MGYYPAKFLLASGLAWQTVLKKTEVKLELLTDIDMLLIAEKEINGGICHAIDQYAKANNKHMKNYGKNKESPYLKNWDVKYGSAQSQKFPVNKFEWIEDMSQFNEDLIKNYNEESEEGYYFAVDVQHPDRLHELHKDLSFLPERMKFGKIEKLVTNLYDKRWICQTYDNSKTSIKLCINFKINS